MRTLILLSAIPGSGKSTWAKRFAQDHPNTFIVASDEVRVAVAGAPQDFSKEDLVWKTFLDEINHYAETYKDCYVIADSTNLLNQYRSFYYHNTPAFDKHVLVVFNIPLQICLDQNKMRKTSRIVPEHAMKMMYEQFEKPSDEVMDLYDEVMFIGKTYHSDKINVEK